MVSMLTYSSKEKENQTIEELTRKLAAYLSEDKWEIFGFSSPAQLKAFLELQPLIDMACYDVTVKGSLDYLGKIRRQYREMLLMLIADAQLSPMEYVRPDILASSLILRPFSEALLKDKLKSMMLDYLADKRGAAEEAFMVEGKDGKTRVPYSRIYYLEARDKKIYLRQRDREVPFYGTMDELEEKLPPTFVRCHRSFLVNQMYVEKILLSQSEIQLTHGMSVPLSRSYKPRFKAMK